LILVAAQIPLLPMIIVLACELIEAQNLRTSVSAPPTCVLQSEMSTSLPCTPKPYFVLLELLISLEAFIYYTISMPMHKVEPEPRAENNSLFRLRA
jgi:hypothetical protein